MTFSSLRTKLILILLVLLSLLATATGLATLSTMKRDSELQAGHILRVASKVLREALNNRASQLSSSVQILATDFGFRRAVATAEQETIESVLANHGNRINARLTLLLSPNGALLVSSDSTIKAADIAPLFQQTQSQNAAAVNDILHLAGQPYQLVLAPVRAPALIAWVGMGFPLDSTLAKQIRGITDLDISFAAAQAQGYQLYTSTLDAVYQQQLPALLDTLINDAGVPHSNPQQDYISLAMPLDQQQQLWAVQHLSNQHWLSSYQQFRHQLLLIFGAALSLTLLAGIIFARSITQPLKALSYFARRIGQGFDETIPVRGNDEVALLSRTLSAMQHDIRQREQQLQFNAEHDSLTGLYNRTAVERLLPALLASSDGSLLQINIQQFKHINDVLGFSNGDILLQQLARRLKLGPELPVMLARLGGDEFLLVYNTLLTEGQVRAKLAALGEGYQLANSQINLKLCIGIYHFFCQQSNVNDALRRVDIALDNARQTPQRTAIYLQGQDESHQRELMLIRDLPEALHNGQFYAVYQPKIDLASQQCSSAEALIRWQHPKLGLIAPDEFIRLAEHSGNISLISDWMLQQVIAQTAKWWQQGLRLQIAVNLSVHDLLNPALADNLNAQLQQYKLSAAALALEVTESAIMQDAATVIAQLQRIRGLGITLAIDDFGTGQSSLAYLKQLPVHELKIDRAFIKDIDHNSNDALIVAATTQLAHSLGFVVTAEGLENQAGLAKLQQCGCDKVQGYYFSRPLQAEAFATWLQHYTSNHPHWLNAQTVK
ncbi:diguanylate cyclase (GGDEF)-like protein [Rheinheimera pacifica]|uniref:putative bifunctional diguanylate cyclase/phosphodiesterase n=1 Tax=Rheinheimera pacifica TaxID=173990 RepID=UPI002854A614|nr:EAL domain-containing protein [Rheinheimera pacifica]MDR6982073.1 diguanylate cyclase (GGDEF)-like protein [Rheinheimera pacifica]